MMKYPNFLKKGNTIGLACPSFGCNADPYLSRYLSAKKKLSDLGYNLIEAPSVYRLENAESNTCDVRAKELLDLYLSDDVDFVLSNGGGEIMVEILPYIDFEMLKTKKPKFFMGYSDNTNFTFTLTTICDIASIYGPHTPDFGMVPWDQAIHDAYRIMQGDLCIQHSYPLCEREWVNNGDVLAPYTNTEPVYWKSKKEVSMEGRIIGGCLDCLVTLVGTPYDQVKAFNERYKRDGIIWYLESCDLHSLAVKRALWQLKNAGWFKYVKGFIFGRPANTAEPFDVSYEKAVYDHLGEYNVPIVLDACIGHVSPTITIINGSYAKIFVKDGKGSLEMLLKD